MTTLSTRSQNLPVTAGPVFRGSDHAPFAEAGVTIGGLFAGAGGVKTQAEAELFGGQVREAHDACYHQACDTIENINFEVLEQMTDATAHVVLELAASAIR